MVDNPDGVIYRCTRNTCTVAIDDIPAISDQDEILLPISKLHFPECESCPELRNHLAILETGPNSLEPISLCVFYRLHGSHRSLVKRELVCPCKPLPQPEPVASPDPETVSRSEPVNVVSQSPVEDTPEVISAPAAIPGNVWTDEEVDTIKVCGTAEDACVRYADTHPGQRNSNAVTQKWMKIQRRGGLLQIGKNCVISDTASVNAGKTAKVISFCEGKHVANVEVIGEALSTYQYDVHQLTGATL